ncbi:MAG: ATP synthase subunit I [Burkholderiaceae bacterium]|jgi:ATP synthase protein I|nr:ATP synthase subunit I [Burkholderiaceae bacterium]
MKWARIICLQLSLAVVVALVAALLGGKDAGLSSILAGMTCVLPNMVFAGGFHIGDRVGFRSSMAVFFVMELIKIVLTVVLMIAVFWLYKDVNWLAFLVSFVIVLKSYILLLFRFMN